MTFNLKAAVERGKAVQAIDLHRECTNCVVTFWAMNQFLHLLGKAWGVQTFVIQQLFLGSNGGAEKQTREKHVNDMEE